jgi:protein-tyrosine-phosphatase
MDVLFVCSANIVRSFMAEAIMKKRLKEKKSGGVSVASAALIDMKGRATDPAALKILEENGIPAESRPSMLLTVEMVERADVIAVMEQVQRGELCEKYPDAEGKTVLLKSFMKGFQGYEADIRDPHGLTTYHYRLCFAELSAAVSGMVDAFQKTWFNKETAGKP